jgi:hypothetical protein
VLLALDLHLGARVLPEQDPVADLDVELADRAVLGNLAVADGDDLALDGLLLGGVGDDDAPLGLLFFLHSLDDHAVLKRADVGHGVESPCGVKGGRAEVGFAVPPADPPSGSRLWIVGTRLE